MTLPWVRLDSNIGTHDKITPLQETADGRSALVLYMCSLGWSGGHATDGFIPRSSLRAIAPALPKPEKLAIQLVEARVWSYMEGGWRIHNYDERQQLEAISAGKRAARSAASAKANCQRWHGKSCTCWKESK